MTELLFRMTELVFRMIELVCWRRAFGETTNGVSGRYWRRTATCRASLDRADEGLCPSVKRDYLRTVTSQKNNRNNYCGASKLPYSLCCELTSPKCPGIAQHPG